MEVSNKIKTAIVLRMGGLGDLLILTPICKALYDRGYQVDYYCGSPTGDVWELFVGLPFIRKVVNLQRISNIDCIKDEDEHLISVEIIKRQYDEVFDLKNSVEENHPQPFYNKDEGWRHTINSNYQNWIDLSLGWSGIDPSTIKDEDKMPMIAPIDIKYTDWANEVCPNDNKTKVIAIQLNASSLIRTWYRANELPKMLHEKYPNDMVLLFDGASWNVISKFGFTKIDTPEGYNKLFCSAALIAKTNVFIAADSGMLHLAAILGIPTVGVYTTVPAWTRAKYYPVVHAIEGKASCRPCFTLHIFCPIRMKEAEEQLTQRERDILATEKAGINVFDAAKKFGTVPRAIQQEHEAAKRRLEALSAREPECVGSVTPEMIIAKTEELLK